MSNVIDTALAHAGHFSDEFLNWLPHNMHVWRAFELEAFRVHARGFRHYSARTIVHVLRHHTAVAEAEADRHWKVNNNHSPYLARLFDLVHPDKAGMWEYRVCTKRRAANLPQVRAVA